MKNIFLFLFLTVSLCFPSQAPLMASGTRVLPEHTLRVIGDGSCGGITPHNHAGLPLELQNLQTAFCAAAQMLPSAHQNTFKAFDYSLYPHSPFYDESQGQNALFQTMAGQASAASPYYLLIAKQHSQQAYNTTFRVQLKLPFSSCVNAEAVASLERILADSMTVAYQSSGSDPNLLSVVEVAAMKKLALILQKLYNGQCCALNSNINVASELRGLGGKEVGGVSLTVKTIDGWVSPTGNTTGQILDYAGLKVVATTSEGDTYVNANFATAFQSKILEVITKEPAALKVIVTKDDPDNCVDYLPALKAAFNAAEFAVWVHFSIEDPASGAAKIVLLGKVPPSGFEGTGDYDDYDALDDPGNPLLAKNSAIPILYWLAKGFTSALIDAGLQFFVNYLDKDGDASAAFNAIDWWSVGWEGLVGCLPWKVGNSKVQKFLVEAGQALLAGIGVVINNYSNGKYNNLSDSNVWYQVALDFGFAILPQIVTNGILKSLRGPIAEYLCKAMCFGSGTMIWSAKGTIAIDKINLGNHSNQPSPAAIQEK